MSVPENIDRKLKDVLYWANQTLKDGQEPPWVWYQFMKLREAIEAIRTGVMVVPTVDSPQSKTLQETYHRRQDCIVPIDNARLHQERVGPQRPR